MGTTIQLQRLSFALLTVLLATGFAAARRADTTAALVGAAECSDCVANNVKPEHAFRGLRVTIKCKSIAGEYETMAAGKLDKHGDFRVGMPTHLLRDDGELNQECFVELHGAENKPCPATLSKVALKSKENGKHTFAADIAGKLPFSSVCSSAFFLHKYFPWHKPLPKYSPHPHYSLPPKSHYFHTIYKKLHPPPVYKPPTPIYTPPTPVYTPSTPVYKPPTPIYTPPTPVYKWEHPHPHPKIDLSAIVKLPFPPHHHHYHPKLPPYSPHPVPTYSEPKKPYTPLDQTEVVKP